MVSAELSDPRAARVKRLRRLTGRSSRGETRRFLAEGVQACREALAAHVQGRAVVRELILAADEQDTHAEIATLAEQSAVAVTWASDAVLAALSETVTPQGIVAVVDFLDVALVDVTADRPTLVAVLADVRDPGNAGSAVRAADAAGADAVVFAGDSVDPYNGKAVRASVGGLFHLQIVTAVGVAEASTGAARRGPTGARR